MNRPRLVLAAGAVIALIVTAGVGVWSATADGRASQFRYRYERPAKGAVLAALQQEIAFYQDRIARNPAGGLDLAALGQAYLKMARATGDLTWFLLAEQAAQRSLANLRVHNTGALLVLAKVAEARHEFSTAIRLARQASGVDGLAIISTAELARGRVAEARRAAQTLVERSPGVGSYTLRALVAIAGGRDQDVLADFRHALAAEEAGETASSAYLRTVWGRFYYQRGRLDLARELYLEALRILPQYPLALVNLAELELRQGKYRAAEDHLTRVVTLTAASPNVYDHVVLRGLARSHELRGDRSGARRFWETAESRLRRDVTSGAFGHRRELAILLLSRDPARNAAEALSLLREELQVRRDPDTLDAYAWALMQTGRWEEASAAMRDALAGGIREARLFYRAALIERHLGHTDAAQRLFALAAHTDPTFDQRARTVAGLGL
ncbi:MAG TPA: tetratricopeptide repeat protein [bacterium]|nr:tetratricopeptide repeat protein [bacterium]